MFHLRAAVEVTKNLPNDSRCERKALSAKKRRPAAEHPCALRSCQDRSSLPPQYESRQTASAWFDSLVNTRNENQVKF